MIEIKNLNYRYINSEKYSLKDINLTVKSGEFVAFIGESGSGKSTLTRVINGLATKFYEGEIEGIVNIKGESILDKELYEIGRTVGSIFQNPKSQFFATIVEDEVAFGCENYGMKREEIECKVADSLNDINGSELKGKQLFHLSSGEKQKVGIASINAMQPSIYVFDEPSANLDMESVEKLKELLLQLKKLKKTVVISEHRLYYLTDLVDCYYYISDGMIRNIWSKNDIKKLSGEDRNRLGLRELNLEKIRPDLFEKKLKNYNKGILEIDKLKFSYKNKRIFQELSFSFERGRIYGLIGENGVGKSTLAKVLCGILKESGGTVKLDEVSIPYRDRKKKIYYLPNNTDCNLFGVTLEEELILNDFKGDIDELLDFYNLKEMKENHPMSLSGGQKQRLTIAAAETLNREVYIFDEPTSGLDAYNMNLISKRFLTLKDKNKVIIIITHDFEFLMKICSKIVCLKSNGEMEEYDKNTEEGEILKIMLGKKGLHESE